MSWRPFLGSGGRTGGRPAGICYAFQRGECDRGSGCRFSHDTNGGDRTEREWRDRSDGDRPQRSSSSQVCYKFQKGECTYGDSCRFSHEASN